MNEVTIHYKFSGHLNSNLFIRANRKTNVTQLWSSQIVPIVNRHLGPTLIGGQTWDEYLLQLLKLGAVYLDQKRMTSPFELDETNVVRFHLMPRRFDTKRFQIQRDVIFQNKDFLVVNKPALLPVHPTLDNLTENLLYLLQQNLNTDVSSVHRLDLETTGLILFAKNDKSMTYLQSLFSQREISKRYLAVVSQDKIPLGRQQHWMEKNPRSPKHIRSTAADNFVSIELDILKQSEFTKSLDASIVDIQLLTGKTHQIRSQLAHLGFPLRGDRLYGGLDFVNNDYDHFLLHAYQLQFTDPAGVPRTFEQAPNWL